MDRAEELLCVGSTRDVGEDTSTERRYFISDLDGRDAQAMRGHVRGHWGIDNQVHGSLEMTFREDTRRNRMGHWAENVSGIGRLALNLLRRDESCKVKAKGKRPRTAMEPGSLLQVLCQGIQMRLPCDERTARAGHLLWSRPGSTIMEARGV